MPTSPPCSCTAGFRQEYNNPQVDLPADAVIGSINLAGGFGSLDDIDDSFDLAYTAPNVNRWATLAIYQRMDGNGDDDDLEQGGKSRRPSIVADVSVDAATHHSHMMAQQGDEPLSFTSFGGGDGSAFDYDEEPEIARARAEEERQSLQFATSPVRRASEAPAFDDVTGVVAPVDESFGFGAGGGDADEGGGGGGGGAAHHDAGDDDAARDAFEMEEPFFDGAAAEGKADDDGDGDENNTDNNKNSGGGRKSSLPPSSPAAARPGTPEATREAPPAARKQPAKRGASVVVFDNQTTVQPRKALKMAPRMLAAPAHTRPHASDVMAVWSHHHAAAAGGSALNSKHLDALLLRPVVGIAAASFQALFSAAMQGQLILGSGSGSSSSSSNSNKPAIASPSKRPRESMTGGAAADEDSVEQARRRSDASAGEDVSVFGGDSDWADGNTHYADHFDDAGGFEAPVDDNVSFGGGDGGGSGRAAPSTRPCNTALEQALRSHQARAASASQSDSTDGDAASAATEDAGARRERDGDALHPRTLVVMREINRELEGGDPDGRSTKGPSSSATLRFEDMISGFGRAPAAAAFFEILALKTRGFIDVQQATSDSDIQISVTGTFVDPGPAADRP